MLAIELALEVQARLPYDAVLAINAGPDVILNEELHAMLRRFDASQVVVELTEHTEVADYAGLVEALTALRNTGARLSIDDTGAGVSSLAHILKLSPEFIKLDRALTSGIDQDPVRRALASSLVSFASDTGSVIVAEGIETAGELAVLRSLGISFGQGYYLGSPQPLPPTRALEAARTFMDIDPAASSIGATPGTDTLIHLAYGQDVPHQI
jgi:EAL domain-containing protein (putative c-di-GMP-specific phosphodiesterase class I)